MLIVLHMLHTTVFSSEVLSLVPEFSYPSHPKTETNQNYESKQYRTEKNYEPTIVWRASRGETTNGWLWSFTNFVIAHFLPDLSNLTWIIALQPSLVLALGFRAGPSFPRMLTQWPSLLHPSLRARILPSLSERRQDITRMVNPTCRAYSS